MELNNKKVYIVGSSTGYASWITNRTLVDTMEEADLVLFTGGEDINPGLYNECVGKHTHYNILRDKYEIREFEKATSLGKAILGICRGAQLACALSGGELVQHMVHPYNHNIKFYDGTTTIINSLHHQMQYPFTIPDSEYTIIAHSEGLSNVYLNGRDNNKTMKSDDNSIIIEPEVVHYIKNRALGIQCHPEMMNSSSLAVKTFNLLVDLLILDKLNVITKLNTKLDNAYQYLYDNPLKEETNKLTIKEDGIESY